MSDVTFTTTWTWHGRMRKVARTYSADIVLASSPEWRRWLGGVIGRDVSRYLDQLMEEDAVPDEAAIRAQGAAAVSLPKR